MFDQLEDELRLIKTNKFHIVDGPADPLLIQAVRESALAVPNSYKEFVLRFGNAKLYRQGSGYKVGVLAAPREEFNVDRKETLYRFGHYDSGKAYFKGSLLREGRESPVFETGGAGLRKIAEGFEEWLARRCQAARRTFKKKEWAEIVAGPAPFSPDELRIVEARRRFSFRRVGVAADGNLLIEVHNGSDLTLPYLSIGVRMTNGLFGGIWLPVSHVLPGTVETIAHDAYRKLSNPEDVELYPLPDPGPEDRSRYWEFGKPEA